MYMSKLVFIMTISHHLKFPRILKLLPNRREDTIGTSLAQVMQLYGSHGFLVTMTNADGEFEMLWDKLASSGSGLNVCSNDKHMSEIEHFIHTLKECTRCSYNSVPFCCLPVLAGGEGTSCWVHILAEYVPAL
jgi:hypothetical protein